MEIDQKAAAERKGAIGGLKKKPNVGRRGKDADQIVSSGLLGKKSSERKIFEGKF